MGDQQSMWIEGFWFLAANKGSLQTTLFDGAEVVDCDCCWGGSCPRRAGQQAGAGGDCRWSQQARNSTQTHQRLYQVQTSVPTKSRNNRMGIGRTRRVSDPCQWCRSQFREIAKWGEPRGAFRRVEKGTGQPAHSKSLVNNKSKELVALSDFSGVLGARSAVLRVRKASECAFAKVRPTDTTDADNED